PRRAVVVDVVDGEAADSHRVESPLPLRAHAVHVAGEGLLEHLGADARHAERVARRVADELREVTLAALELRHADTDHAHVLLCHRRGALLGGIGYTTFAARAFASARGALDGRRRAVRQPPSPPVATARASVLPGRRCPGARPGP